MARFLDDDSFAILQAALDRVIPAGQALGAPGAVAAGVADYVDGLLGAFAQDPPRIWAGGPFSGRHGGEAGFGDFVPLSALEELAWRTRIEGSRGLPEREFNGPVLGLQEQYRDGLAALGTDFPACDPDEQVRRLDADADFKALVYRHGCEGLYGDPIYGGNRNGRGWQFIAFEGDSQPRGYTPTEVTEP